MPRDSPGNYGRSRVTGHALKGIPRDYKPPRDRMVDTTSVPCPTCKAPVGVTCGKHTGTQTHHRPRRVMALRKEREQS